MKIEELDLCISYDDVMIVPTYSEVKSRSEPSTKTMVGFVELEIPMISSPMDTVTELDMALAMSKSGGMGIIHRFLEPKEQAKMLNMALNELEATSNYNENTANLFGTIGAAIGVGDIEFERLKCLIDTSGKDRFITVAIDVANGFSSYMRDMIHRVRDVYGDKINIIAGNVATGDGYTFLANAGANAIRAGIGGGCFVPGTMVLTDNGLKPIELIKIGDYVKTHTGSWKEVINIMNFPQYENIISLNDIMCTINHEFYVIKKSDEDLVTEENIHHYAFWVEAYSLDEDEHLLLDVDFKPIKIQSIEYLPYNGKVYDLTVKDDHSYSANGIIVHNSICKTRIQTGVGIPTLSTILDSVRCKPSLKNPPSIIADGGIRYPGDMAKSIAAGADAIMVGRILAGTKETPGEVINGKKI